MLKITLTLTLALTLTLTYTGPPMFDRLQRRNNSHSDFVNRTPKRYVYVFGCGRDQRHNDRSRNLQRCLLQRPVGRRRRRLVGRCSAAVSRIVPVRHAASAASAAAVPLPGVARVHRRRHRPVRTHDGRARLGRGCGGQGGDACTRGRRVDAVGDTAARRRSLRADAAIEV